MFSCMLQSVQAYSVLKLMHYSVSPFRYVRVISYIKCAVSTAEVIRRSGCLSQTTTTSVHPGWLVLV